MRNMRVGGPYTITISYVGFKTKEIKNVYLTLGKTYDFNAVLQSDSQTLDEVIVQASTDDTFSNDRTGAETSIGKEAISSLPTISRSVNDFTRLEPSAGSDGSFGGSNNSFNNYSLDGSIFSNPFGLDSPTPGGQTGSNPVSLDAIEQISVSLAPYDVTQAGFTGASINAVTKSGTNEFHGTVYGFFRNEDMTGDKVNGDKVFNGDLEQKQYGFSIGGPLVKNKLFFFANFEKDERTDLGSAWTPNTGTGSASESRVLESDLIDVRNALLGLGYDPGAYEGFTHATESVKGIFKLDWNINDNNRLAVIYNFLDASKEKPAHPTAFFQRGPSFNTLQFENAGYEINNELNSILFELNSNITDNVSNKLQVGYTDFNDFRDPFSTPAPIITILKDGSPYIIAGHEPFSINNKLEQTVFQITNNMTYFTGNHVVTIGFSFEKFKFKNSFNLARYDNFSFPYRGTFNIPGFGGPYPSVEDFLSLSGPGGVTDKNIDYAISQFNNASSHNDGEVGGFNQYEAHFGQMSFYAQDEWTATDNFKLTYGIRFDKPLYFNTSQLAQDFIDVQLASNPNFYDPTIEYYNPKDGSTVFIDNTKMPTNDILISPRVGFNWDIKGDNTFQVRGGSGIFTGRLPFVWLGNQIVGADQGFFQAVDPDFQWPSVWRSNVGVDYKFNNGLV
ncbi:MAG: TonB-dependent receptor, partial [Bacteroidetes bacterium]|nr:TonB-dependent receptor [Bacteroidota bacterium]